MAWEMNAEDFAIWEKLLNHGINKALDYGVDSIAFLDAVAETLYKVSDPTSTSCSGVVDLLLGQLDMSDARQAPDALMEFVNATLMSSYPPEPRNTQASSWLLRSLANVIDKCPRELAGSLLETIQEGLSTWFSDEFNALPGTEYVEVRLFRRFSDTSTNFI